jgi:hypothetical protein
MKETNMNEELEEVVLSEPDRVAHPANFPKEGDDE